MAAHSSILAWRVPKNRGAWGATVHAVSESDTTEQLNAQMTNSVEHLFIGLSATCKSSLVKCLFRRFAHFREFPGGPEVKRLSFQCSGCRFNPCWGAKSPMHRGGLAKKQTNKKNFAHLRN